MDCEKSENKWFGSQIVITGPVEYIGEGEIDPIVLLETILLTASLQENDGL